MQSALKHTGMALALLVFGTIPLFGCVRLPVPTEIPPLATSLAPTLVATSTATHIPSTHTPLPTETPTLLPSPTIPAATNTPVVPTPRLTPTRAPIPTLGTSQIRLFYVALGDNGKAGKMIGCGDSVVPVTRPIPETSAPLTAALRQLLADHNQFYGQSGLYNALYQSNLSTAGVSIIGGKAIINLSGTLRLGGVCDDPRVLAQLQETALQFPTVNQVAISVNGVPIEKLLSEK